MKPSLRKLTISELLDRTFQNAKTEQAATLALLEHLAEVERRKAYAGKTGLTIYTSLFDYIRRGLNYSDSQAAERVAATRLLLQSPTVKPAIQTGSLSLTSAAQVQRFIERERRLSKITHSAEALTQAVAGKSKREAEQELFTRASPKTQAAMNERVRPVYRSEPSAPKQVQVHATLDESLVNSARSLVYTESVSELLERALKLYVEHHSKRQGRQNLTDAPTKNNAVSPCRQSPKAAPPVRATISIHLRRAVWARAQSQCEYAHSNGHRCPSNAGLEIDHRFPVVLGGSNDAKNLQLLCRTHNQLKGARVE